MSRKYITKTGYMKSCQCNKAFYLWWHKEREEFGEGAQSRMDEGTRIGKLAHALAPDGIDLSDLDLSPWELDEPTQRFMAENRPIYEAAFMTGSRPLLLCKVDILVPDGNGGWEIWEVKSSTSVKDEYIHDVAFQAYVAEECGVQISRCVLVHLNADYIRQGELDPNKLFTREDITDEVEEEKQKIADNIESRYKQTFSAHAPQVPIGSHCSSPYDCGFQHICWAQFPQKDSIYVIPRLGKRADDYLKGEQYHLHEIDPDDLTEKQQKIWHAHNRDEVIHDRDAISGFFADKPYPHYFLDFETVMPAIPIWDGTGPYDQIPFQYSLHVIREEGAEPEHYGYLHKPDGSDPRKALIEHMLKRIGDAGTVWAYNKSFETARITEMASAFPEYYDQLTQLERRIHDLIEPFRNLWYYHPDMQGSNSIKDVLPVLVPELSYKDMAIGNGSEAMDTYLRLLHRDEELVEKQDELLEAMWLYCKLDTWAMVCIFKQLNQ